MQNKFKDLSLNILLTLLSLLGALQLPHQGMIPNMPVIKMEPSPESGAGSPPEIRMTDLSQIMVDGEDLEPLQYIQQAIEEARQEPDTTRRKLIFQVVFGSQVTGINA